MRYVIAKEREKIPLGRVAENEVETVRFYIKGWEELYGSGGTYVLAYKRPIDEQPYICTTTVSEDGYVDWVIHNEDCAYAGNGEAQFSYVINNKIAKSVIYTTVVLRSLGQTGELPEPYDTRIQELIDTVVEAQEVAEEAASYSANPPVINEQTGNWDLWDGSEYVDSGYPSRGERGKEDIFWVNSGLTLDYPPKPVTTVAEIQAALNNGQFPIVKITSSYPNIYLPFMEWQDVTEGQAEEYVYVNGQWQWITTGGGSYEIYYFGYVDASGYWHKQTLKKNMGDSTETWSSYSHQQTLARKTDLQNYVQTTRKVNNKSLSSNVTLTAEDIGYDGTLGSHTSGSVGAKLKEHTDWLDSIPIQSGTGNGSVIIKNVTDNNRLSVSSGAVSLTAGENCTASGNCSVAIGDSVIASGVSSIAIGGAADDGGNRVTTEVSGGGAVAMGNGNKATGIGSFAVGMLCDSSAHYSNTLGLHLKSTGRACTVFGQYNEEDTNAVDTSHGGQARKYIFMVGNGTATNARSNALTVDWDGNEEIQGSLTIGKGTADEVTITAAQLKALLALLNV